MIHTKRQIVDGTFADDTTFLRAATVTDREGATFEPWTDTFALGFKITLASGLVRYVYLNPSSDSDDGTTNVFLYMGTSDRVDEGDPITYLDISDHQ